MNGSIPSLTTGGNNRDVTDGEVSRNFIATGLPLASNPAESVFKLTGR